MKSGNEFEERVREIVADDPRFAVEAYVFVAEAVSYTTRRVAREETDKRHISGQELLEGIRDLALKQFGPLTIDVLHEWGVRTTDDFGAVVFNLVNNGLLGASEDDSPEDFSGGYDFREAFTRPFVETGAFPDDLPTID